MKKTVLLSIFMLTLFQGFSQTQGISYQAVLLNPNPQQLPGVNAQNNILANTSVGIQFTIIDGSGNEEFKETHSASTDMYGMLNLLIGGGNTISSNSFSDIYWDGATKKLKVSIDFSGGSNYQPLSEQDLTFIPQPPTEEVAQGIAINTIGIEAEINRATAAEELNATGISSLEVEQQIQNTAITLNTAKAGITVDQVTTIRNTTGSNSGDQDISGIAVNTTEISNETARAIAAEQSNTTDISTIETDQATQNTAIAVNTTEISNETARAIAAEQSNTTDISTIQTDQTTQNTDVAANTAKVGYTEAAVSANTDVAANTAKVGYTEAAVSANTDVVANTAKVGYTDELVSANTDVAANTAKVGYTEAAVSANTDVAANTAKVGYTEELVSANTDVAANTAKVGYTEELVSANTDVAANTAKVGVTTHAIGDSFGGGIVFFVYDGGQHGLIAATADQSSGIRWHGGSYTNTRARADGIGAGLKNTAIIIANQGPVDGNAFAATVCNEYSVTLDGVTYGDWYLPSKYELNLMYENIGPGNFMELGNVGNFTTNYYWSSTEFVNDVAWRQFFSNGEQHYNNKAFTLSVRAVRAF